jgi:hypothetical protein
MGENAAAVRTVWEPMDSGIGSSSSSDAFTLGSSVASVGSQSGMRGVGRSRIPLVRAASHAGHTPIPGRAGGKVRTEVIRRIIHPKYAIDTVRWSNFDRRNPRMGVLLPSTEATPCGHDLK